MKKLQQQLILLLFVALAFSYIGASQKNEPSNDNLDYQVNRLYPYILITKEKLKEAKTLVDIDKLYQSSWVEKYISVEITASLNGAIKKAVNKSEVLSEEQKTLMNMADAGSDISVKVLYLPKNTLADNEVKTIAFTFAVNPDSDAKYIGGAAAMRAYLKAKAIDEIPSGSFTGYDLAVAKFTVNEAGQIVEAHMFEPAKDKKIDELILTAIRNMPNWLPATYANGLKVKQEFVLTVGNMDNCTIHLLNRHWGE